MPPDVYRMLLDVFIHTHMISMYIHVYVHMYVYSYLHTYMHKGAAGRVPDAA